MKTETTEVHTDKGSPSRQIRHTLKNIDISIALIAVLMITQPGRPVWIQLSFLSVYIIGRLIKQLVYNHTQDVTTSKSTTTETEETE
jgi:hypothetical protein